MSYYDQEDIELKKGDKGDEVRELQEDLKKLGYDIGRIDGDFGPRTDKAVRSFQQINFVNGVVNYYNAASIHEKAAQIAGKELPHIPFVPSPNFSSRKGRHIDMLVIHFTASGSLDNTLEWFENPNADASAHYIIGKDGKIVQMVKEEDKAWHAGKSKWGGEINCNNFSIGIELVNWGILKKKNGDYYCWPGNYSRKYRGPEPVAMEGKFWEPYGDEQYESLILLSTAIVRRYAIPFNRILGHNDIAPGRKVDPGPNFDWERLKGKL